MEVDVRSHGRSRYTVHVSLSADEVKGEFDRTYQQLSDRGGIRGFRPGKIPRQILDRNYDYDVIRAGTYESLVHRRLEETLEEHDLRPMDQLDIEVGAPPDDDEALAETIKSGLAGDESAEEAAEEEEPLEEPLEAEEDLSDIPLTEGEPFEFYVSFAAYPRPKLPDLSELKLRRPIVEIGDEAIEERIDRIRQAAAEEFEVDRETIEEGDLVVADVKIVLEDEDPDEMSSREQEIVVGNREYIGDLDRALVGHEAGDTVEVTYEYPEDHPDTDLAGRAARVIAEISEFSGRVVPELDDEFAQNLGDYEGIDDLRASIREQLEAEAEREVEQELHAQVTRHIVQNTEIELPDALVERAVERSREDLMGELEGVGMSMEELAAAGGTDEEQLRARQERDAVESLTLHFATQALTEERGIEVTDEDAARELQRIADETGGDMEMVQQAAAVQPGFGDEVRDRVMRRKLMEDIVASAEIEGVPQEQYEAEEEARRQAEAPEVVAAEDAEERPIEAPEDAQAEDAAAAPEDEETVSADETAGMADEENAVAVSNEDTEEPVADEGVQESESQ